MSAGCRKLLCSGERVRSAWPQVAPSEPVLRSVRKLQSCMFATSGGFAQFDKLRENV